MAASPAQLCSFCATSRCDLLDWLPHKEADGAAAPPPDLGSAKLSAADIEAKVLDVLGVAALKDKRA